MSSGSVRYRSLATEAASSSLPTEPHLQVISILLLPSFLVNCFPDPLSRISEFVLSAFFFFLLVCLDFSSRIGSWFSFFFSLLLISYSLGAFCPVYKFLQEVTRLGLIGCCLCQGIGSQGERFSWLLEFAGIRSYVIWLEQYSTNRRRHCGNTWWARNSNTSLVSFSLCWFYFSFPPWYVLQQLNPNPVHLWNK